VGGTKFESCKCNSSVFGKECSCECAESVISQGTLGKARGLYQAKDITNRLLLKEQFCNLRMDESTKIYDHLSTLNNIISELECIKVKIDDEDKALRLILSLPPSYVHFKPALMYGKESLSFEEVATKIIYEKRRIKSDESISSSSMLLTRSWDNGKKIHAKNMSS